VKPQENRLLWSMVAVTVVSGSVLVLKKLRRAGPADPTS
jgi:hypothetical protein